MYKIVSYIFFFAISQLIGYFLGIGSFSIFVYLEYASVSLILWSIECYSNLFLAWIYLISVDFAEALVFRSTLIELSIEHCDKLDACIFAYFSRYL